MSQNARASEDGKESQIPYGDGGKGKPARESEQGWSDETEPRSPEKRPQQEPAESGGKRRSESLPTDE